MGKPISQYYWKQVHQQKDIFCVTVRNHRDTKLQKFENPKKIENPITDYGGIRSVRSNLKLRAEDSAQLDVTLLLPRGDGPQTRHWCVPSSENTEVYHQQQPMEAQKNSGSDWKRREVSFKEDIYPNLKVFR
jgi:hypothetical protein